MANVMLTSDTAKDPNKPFKLRVEDVCSKFDALVTQCLLLIQTEEQFPNGTAQAGVEEQVVKNLEQFNSVCDELYKEILRRKEKLLNMMEKGPRSADLHRQIQTAGHLAQVVGDFTHFLETGQKQP